MLKIIYAITVGCLITTASGQNSPPELLAEWNFDEGRGDVAGDSSGNGHDAKISGAAWVKQADGFALFLDGLDDYVDCGPSRDLGITSPITLEAWVKPLRRTADNAILLGAGMRSYLWTLYTKDVCWYVNHRGGKLANWMKAELDLGEWHHVVATFDGKQLGLWVNGRAKSRDSVIDSYQPEGRFWMGTKGRPNAVKFKGMLDRVRVYGAALPDDMIIAHFKEEAVDYGFDPAWFKRVRVTPYYYLDRGEIVIEADFRRLQPLSGTAVLLVSLSHKKDPYHHLQQRAIEPLPEEGILEVNLPVGDLADGDYVISVTLQQGSSDWPVEMLTFSYPASPRPIISPAERTVASLPAPRPPTGFDVDVAPGGGFTVTINGARYPFRTRISWPRGDFNHFTADATGIGQTSWKPNTTRISPTKYTVDAHADQYQVHRDLEVFPTHIYIKDTFTNTTDEDLGLLIYHETPLESDQVVESLLSGRDKRGRQRDGRVPDWGPTAFFTDANTGMGMVPLDDVFVIQVTPYIDWQGAAGLCTEKFALAPDQSYTLEWSIYPTGSGDYYDFINRFRKVENRIGTVPAAASFITHNPHHRRQVPSAESVKNQGIGIGLISGLGGAADDPQISIQGIEFLDFPREREMVRRQMAAIHQRRPGFKAVLHIAHSIYTTDRPDQFADSKVVDPDGKQHLWNYGYGYLGKDRQDEGWRSYIFYPTPGNSFHDALMRSADVVMDEMGCDGVFMDGFLAGYISRWTFDRWDGHSAQIDLETKTIQRKMGSVLLLSQPSLIEFSRKIHDKGGIVIANNAVTTRSLAQEKYILHDTEAGAGPELHLAPNIMGLGRTAKKGEKAIYEDILDTLRWGNLYMGYYLPRVATGPLTRPTMLAKQFPMTFEEIRSGMVKGRQRIVTMNSGIYGWREHRDLHLVHKYDARGAVVSHDYLTTIDSAGVRTELDFNEYESAVVEPVPVTVDAPAPVNARVLQFDDQAVHVLLNGNTDATLEVFVGAQYFRGKHDSYRVTHGGHTTIIDENDGTLPVPLHLAGPIEVVIEKQGD